ncbi:MAG: sulfotransferase [Lysobacterales bacterium]
MSPMQFRQRFDRLTRDGLFDAANTLLADWCKQMPRAFEPRFHQVQLELQRGRYRVAREAAVAVLAHAECPPQMALDVALCLRSFSLHDPLIAWAARYPFRSKMPAADIAHAATLLSAVGAHRLALDWANQAVASNPADPVGRFNRALILNYLGDSDRAASELEGLLKRTPPVAMAYWLLSRLKRQTAASNHVDAIQSALATPRLAASDRAFLGYALFKELDDLGEISAAWEALSAASAAARIDRPYHRASEEQLFAALRRTFPLAEPTPTAVSADTTPIFIVGLHRSGTSLIERMLGASSQVHDAGETDRFAAAIRDGADRVYQQVPEPALLVETGRIDFARARATFDASAHHQSGGRRFVTEKAPANFLNIGLIRHALPHARILHMRRDPIDLCFANYREMFGASVSHTYALDDLVHYHELYRGLMRHWHEHYPGFILDIDYENLVRHPERESRRVFDFCGLEWHAGVVDVQARAQAPVATLSSVQVRQPVSTASIGRWRPYARWLGTLTEAFPPDDAAD